VKPKRGARSLWSRPHWAMAERPRQPHRMAVAARVRMAARGCRRPRFFRWSGNCWKTSSKERGAGLGRCSFMAEVPLPCHSEL
jgi:hypothetical protein